MGNRICRYVNFKMDTNFSSTKNKCFGVNHYFFTYRAQIITVITLVMILEENFRFRPQIRRIKEYIKKKAVRKNEKTINNNTVLQRRK